MSGRVGAWPAGEKSSVLISPSTLKTLRVSLAGNPGRDRNHSPAAQDFEDGLGVGIRRGQIGDGLETAVDEHDLLQGLGGRRGDRGIGERLDQRIDIEAAEHGPENADGVLPRDGRRLDGRLGHCGQPTGLDPGGRIDARGDPVLEQSAKPGAVGLVGRFESFADLLDLRGCQRQRRQTRLGPFFLHLVVGVEHRSLLVSDLARLIYRFWRAVVKRPLAIPAEWD